jgi:hypothetical protein
MYSRTQNEDGSYSTRCLECSLTIASSARSETELDDFEVTHICAEKILDEFLAPDKPAIDPKYN